MYTFIYENPSIKNLNKIFLFIIICDYMYIKESVATIHIK